MSQITNPGGQPAGEDAHSSAAKVPAAPYDDASRRFFWNVLRSCQEDGERLAPPHGNRLLGTYGFGTYDAVELFLEILQADHGVTIMEGGVIRAHWFERARLDWIPDEYFHPPYAHVQLRVVGDHKLMIYEVHELSDEDATNLWRGFVDGVPVCHVKTEAAAKVETYAAALAMEQSA